MKNALFYLLTKLSLAVAAGEQRNTQRDPIVALNADSTTLKKH